VLQFQELDPLSSSSRTKAGLLLDLLQFRKESTKVGMHSQNMSIVQIS
jgi:hypothetical protein